MSWVTNVVLKTPIICDKDEMKRIEKEINIFFEDGRGARGNRGFVNIEDPSLPTHWYGGNKGFEAELWIGAFNYLDIDGLKEHLKTIDWNTSPLLEEWIQIIYKDDDEDKFSIIEFKV